MIIPTTVLLEPPTIDYSGDAIKETAKGRRVSLRFKRELWESSNRQCSYCGAHIETHKAVNVDHIKPISKGGSHHVSNLTCSCRRCNNLKGQETVEYLKFALSFHGSDVSKIISPYQAIKLVNLGLDIGLKIKPLYFETAKEEK